MKHILRRVIVCIHTVCDTAQDLVMTLLFLNFPLCLSSLFLFFSCFWIDLLTNEGCSFNAKLLATCPRWSFLSVKICFSSPRWAVYARTHDENASFPNFFIFGCDNKQEKILRLIILNLRFTRKWTMKSKRCFSSHQRRCKMIKPNWLLQMSW